MCSDVIFIALILQLTIPPVTFYTHTGHWPGWSGKILIYNGINGINGFYFVVYEFNCINIINLNYKVIKLYRA